MPEEKKEVHSNSKFFEQEEEISTSLDLSYEQADQLLDSVLSDIAENPTQNPAVHRKVPTITDIDDEPGEVTTKSIKVLETQQSDIGDTGYLQYEQKAQTPSSLEEESQLLAQRREQEESLEKKRFWASAFVAVVIVLIGLVIGVFVYRYLAGDSLAGTGHEQSGEYTDLVHYADEFSMLSDTEKRELLDLQSAYDSLTSMEKDEINDYFLEQTGQTYNELLNTYKLYEENQAREAAEKESAKSEADSADDQGTDLEDGEKENTDSPSSDRQNETKDSADSKDSSDSETKS